MDWVCVQVAKCRKRLAVVEERERPLSLFAQSTAAACAHC
jgi:hypothetical protein